MSKDNGKTVDAITAERMRLAGLHVPGEVSEEQTAWEREVIRENNVREQAGQLLTQRNISVDESFRLGEEFVDTAFRRMDELQRRKPGRKDAKPIS